MSILFSVIMTSNAFLGRLFEMDKTTEDKAERILSIYSRIRDGKMLLIS